MDIQRKAFESSNNVNPDWSFKFDEELQQYVATDFEMTNQVDEFNEHWDTFRAGWQAKAQAVPEKTVKLHLVWNENKDECVGFLDSKDARYTATGDDRGMFGVTALGDYFRDLNDERDEFETQIVMIEVQEPAND